MKSRGRSVPTASAAWAGHTPGPGPLPELRLRPRVPKTFLILQVVLLFLSLRDTVTSEPVGDLHADLQRASQSPSEIKCQPGSYLSPETRACNPCTAGIDYTSSLNSLASCRPCSVCKEDKEEKSKCNSTRDTECQCKPGTFEDENSPEFCQRCLECTNGDVEKTPCTPKTNRKCDPKYSFLGLIIGLVVSLLASVALAIIWKTGVWKRVLQDMKRAYPGRERNPESANAVNVSLMRVQTSSMGSDSHCNTEPEEAVNSPTGRKLLGPAKGIDAVDALKQIFSYCPNVVPYNSWNSLMRQMGLTDNEIQVVRAETLALREVLYQMLLRWLNQTGRDASINHLLDALEAVGERWARHEIEDYAVKSGKFLYQEATAEPGMVTHTSTEETELG
ncbi:tumor necrosis factor receptor superfamily member 10B-like [Peromyscus californicus insignis]|uniref:tumor necrosis factor receptor superfamily member 10B-like n=1 Tax=Peromyscus californicus insignis TaxID=564181 RepID=UPI0022A68589|nr:tumor necrosis factor receptor superfamily member 10B-like [Peromyscus californicus insignis]